jgi:hypothetical protein
VYTSYSMFSCQNELAYYIVVVSLCLASLKKTVSNTGNNIRPQ